jgi:CBS domain-containing protein
MRTVAEILRRKAKQAIISVQSAHSVLEAVRQMDVANTGSAVVLEGTQLVGIFTERDLMRRVVLQGRDVAATRVADVMTRDLIYCEPDEPADQVMGKITQHRCRHLPVVDGGKLVGVISIGDLTKEFAADQAVEIEFLKQYISST